MLPAQPTPSPIRLAVYTDYSYRRDHDGAVYAQRAFARFLAQVAAELGRMVLVGRLEPEPGRSHYRLPPEIDFVPLPHYASASSAVRSALPFLRSLARFWAVLGRVDAVWLLGPHPLVLGFAALALLRRRPIALGVRQDLPTYARSRHPGRRAILLAALALEGANRALARRVPTVVVGPDLARRYASARRLLAITVSLVREADILAPEAVAERRYDGELRVLSVGRLEAEKNPLLLADVLARLRRHDGEWKLVVCGEGSLAAELSARLRGLGMERHAELRGYVPIDRGLLDLYRSSQLFLHVSWTEGLPQVLFEAFAAGLPVVATAVGGVREAVGGSALLVPPGDPDAAASELIRLARDAGLRRELAASGVARVRARTLEAEARRVAMFLSQLGGTTG